MKFRRHFPVMLGEYWIYVLAVVISITTLMLLYSHNGPIGLPAGGDGRADHPRTASIPDDATTGQSTPPPMSQRPQCDFHRDCKSYTSPLNLAPLRRDFFLTP